MHSNGCVIDKVRFIGRFDFSDPQGPRFAWSASTIIARFYGTGISVRLSSPSSNYFTVLLDGAVVIPRLHVTGENIYTLASNLPLGNHDIELVKRTEFNIGMVQYLGFEVENGELLEHPNLNTSAYNPGRRIEIIGDSISCGFGNEGDPATEYEPIYDNAYLAFGPLCARMLKAEFMVISCSGYGIMREYTGNTDNIMPNVYDLVLPDFQTKWDFSGWIPQIVVINLGTNDFSFGFIPDREAFVQSYIRFIRRVRANYPDAHIICSIGPVIKDEVLEKTREYLIHGVIDYFKSNGEKQIHFLEFETQKEENGYGITYHPSVRTHEIMASKLAEKIRSIINWS